MPFWPRPSQRGGVSLIRWTERGVSAPSATWVEMIPPIGYLSDKLTFRLLRLGQTRVKERLQALPFASWTRIGVFLPTVQSRDAVCRDLLPESQG